MHYLREASARVEIQGCLVWQEHGECCAWHGVDFCVTHSAIFGRRVSSNDAAAESLLRTSYPASRARSNAAAARHEQHSLGSCLSGSRESRLASLAEASCIVCSIETAFIHTHEPGAHDPLPIFLFACCNNTTTPPTPHVFRATSPHAPPPQNQNTPRKHSHP